MLTCAVLMTASRPSRYMQSILKIRFDRRKFEKSMDHKVKGIGQDLLKEKKVTQACADSFVAYKWMEAAGQAWLVTTPALPILFVFFLGGVIFVFVLVVIYFRSIYIYIYVLPNNRVLCYRRVLPSVLFMLTRAMYLIT